ncbi:unnamed protein product [Heligmosomoides polygyrus]|uniref:Transposase n=1 Tax=Heligmosomoides polygyrus TaxID=6339 RepID=A0A3P8A2Y0_HELPZ|nr:unnamed protein product [Heligmosomoides polygyrus]
MYGINGATASHEAALIAGQLDNVPNSSIDNSLEDLHAVRKQANRTDDKWNSRTQQQIDEQLAAAGSMLVLPIRWPQPIDPNRFIGLKSQFEVHFSDSLRCFSTTAWWARDVLTAAGGCLMSNHRSSTTASLSHRCGS